MTAITGDNAAIEQNRVLKRPAEASWVTIVLFFICLMLMATTVYFFARGTIGSSTVTIQGAPTTESAAIQAQVEQLVRSQDQLVNAMVAVFGIGATMVTVVLALASYLFDRRNRDVNEELNATLASEREGRETAENTARQGLDAMNRRLDLIEARIQYASPTDSKREELARSEFKQLRESILSRISGAPDVAKDVRMLLTSAREINGMRNGEGIGRDQVAELLFVASDADKEGRWDAVQSEYYEFTRAIMNFVGNVDLEEYLSGVSLGPVDEPEPLTPD